MKKQLLAIAVIVAVCSNQAQGQLWQTSGTTSQTTVAPYDNVLIPGHATVYGGISTSTITTSGSGTFNYINCPNIQTPYIGGPVGSSLELTSYSYLSLSSSGGTMTLGSTGHLGTTLISTGISGQASWIWGLNCFSSNLPNTGVMAIDNTGRIFMGGNVIDWASANQSNIANLGRYKLYVEEGILAEKVKVAWLQGTHWPDYVFNKDYDLMPLSEVENYINENSHLPEIPSAAETAKDGIDLAIMDAQLLKKIEELTLYVIQQQKQLEKQQKEIEALKTKN